jgi:hypothetical protein
MVRPFPSILLACVALSFVSCASDDLQGTVAGRERALSAVRDYIARHHLTLPRKYTIEAKDSLEEYEFQPPRLLYAVALKVPRRRKQQELYRWIVDPRSWQADFTDMRTLKPLW